MLDRGDDEGRRVLGADFTNFDGAPKRRRT
jgi:hypothetical protein